MCVFFRCMYASLYACMSGGLIRVCSVQCACVQQYTCVYMYASLYHMLLEINLP